LAFTLEQLQCLKSLAPTLEGRTKKLQVVLHSNVGGVSYN
jgi:hypothetical protein